MSPAPRGRRGGDRRVTPGGGGPGGRGGRWTGCEPVEPGGPGWTVAARSAGLSRVAEGTRRRAASAPSVTAVRRRSRASLASRRVAQGCSSGSRRRLAGEPSPGRTSHSPARLDGGGEVGQLRGGAAGDRPVGGAGADLVARAVTELPSIGDLAGDGSEHRAGGGRLRGPAVCARRASRSEAVGRRATASGCGLTTVRSEKGVAGGRGYGRSAVGAEGGRAAGGGAAGPGCLRARGRSGALRARAAWSAPSGTPRSAARVPPVGVPFAPPAGPHVVERRPSACSAWLMSSPGARASSSASARMVRAKAAAVRA